MKRGDIVTVALQGEFGKPRPALVIETDLLVATDSVLVCLVTSTLRDDSPFRRHRVEAVPSNGLRTLSDIMIDQIFAVRRTKCGPPIGALDKAAMMAISQKLALLVGIADGSNGG